MLIAQVAGGEAGIVAHLGQLERIAQAPEIGFVHGDHEHEAVSGGEATSGRDPRPHAAAFEVVGHQVDDLQGRRGLQEARVHIAAARLVAASIDGRRERLEGVERGRHVDHDRDHAVGHAVRPAIGGDEPGEGLEDRVHGWLLALRASLAEAGDRDVDDAGIDGRHVLVGNAETGGHAGPKALEEDVGARY